MSNGPRKPVVRVLTQDERNQFTSALIFAEQHLNSFRDALALMRPFFDETCETAYTDKYARVGVGPWFFTLNIRKQAAVVLHECMHVLNNHFSRFESIGVQGKIPNLAGDLEINSGIHMMPDFDISDGILPERDYAYKANQSMEMYYHLLNQDVQDNKFGDGSDPDCPVHGEKGNAPSQGSGNDESSDDDKGAGSNDSNESGDETQQGGNDSGDSLPVEANSDGTGDGSGSSEGTGSCSCKGKGGKSFGDEGRNTCDEATEDRSAAADEAGIERASDAEQTIAKQNTIARVAEDIKNKKYGPGAGNDFLVLAQRMMTPPRVPWQTIFRRAVSRLNENIKRGRADYSYRRINRRSSHSDYIFPGMIQYQPTVMLGIDTSGSMSNNDYSVSLSEIEGILKAVGKQKDALKIFCVDTKISGIQPVKSVSKIDLTGGGGTDMSVAFNYVNSLSKREQPDVFVLATDGGVPWPPVVEALQVAKGVYKSIILITNKACFEGCPQTVKNLATVIDISQER